MPAKITLFDTEPCSRCGGTGQYSFNQVDGTRCYGCSGTGAKIVRKHAAMAREWAEALRKVKQPIVSDIEPGDMIARHGKWVTVERIDVDKSIPMGWLHIDDERVEHAWKAVVTYADGTSQDCSTNSILRRRSTTEAVLRLVSEKTAKHVRERRAEAS